jgi:hypothetical protein
MLKKLLLSFIFFLPVLGSPLDCPPTRVVLIDGNAFCFENATEHDKKHKVTWSHANDWAIKHGGRLPTAKELDLTSGSGKGWDNKFLWTSERCNDPGEASGHYIHRRNGIGVRGDSLCLIDSQKALYSYVIPADLENAPELNYTADKISTKSLAPSNPVLGDFYVDTTGALCVCLSNGYWTKVSGSGSCS